LETSDIVRFLVLTQFVFLIAVSIMTPVEVTRKYPFGEVQKVKLQKRRLRH
jgi:hypothetical protein